MASSVELEVNVKVGPAFRICLDVIDLAVELLDLIPDYHRAERGELESRLHNVAEVLSDGLRTERCKPDDSEPG